MQGSDRPVREPGEHLHNHPPLIEQARLCAVALCARTIPILALGEAQEPRKQADKKQRECFECGGSLGLNRVVPGNPLEGLKGCGDGVEGSKKTMN